MGLLSRGAEMVFRRNLASSGVDITYRRGGAIVSVVAVVGKTPIGVSLSGAISQSWQTTDFLIATEDLVIGGRETLPEVGDVITLDVRGADVDFVVCQTDDQRCYRPTDSTEEMLRIHTRKKG